MDESLLLEAVKRIKYPNEQLTKAIENGFASELASLINRHSLESDSNTSDMLLSDLLINCLLTYNRIVFSKTAEE